MPALTNVVAHAGASRCSVRLERSGETVTLVVEDDGAGLAPGARWGVGLASMQERAVELGGELTVRSDAGGTRVVAVVPAGGGA